MSYLIPRREDPLPFPRPKEQKSRCSFPSYPNEHIISASYQVRETTYRADRKINTLQVSGSVDIEALVNNTTLFTWFHGASSQTVPGSLDVVYSRINPSDKRRGKDIYIPRTQLSIASSSSFVYLISWWTFFASYGSDALCQVPEERVI